MFDIEVLSFLKQSVPAFSSLDVNGSSKDAIRTDPAVDSAAIISYLESFAADGLYEGLNFHYLAGTAQGFCPFGRVCGLMG